MNQVSAASKAPAQAASLGASLQKASETPTPTAKPKLDKKPIVGKYGDDGILVTVKQPATGAKLHNQQTVILECLNKRKGTANRLDLVKDIETDPVLLKRMDTVQPVFRCVKYHERKLTQAGLIRVEKIVAAPAPSVAEKK